MDEQLTSPERLLYAYLDGELEPVHEERLFEALAHSADLRTSMRDQLAIRAAVHGDLAALAPPPDATRAVFTALGFTVPAILAPAAGAGAGTPTAVGDAGGMTQPASDTAALRPRSSAATIPGTASRASSGRMRRLALLAVLPLLFMLVGSGVTLWMLGDGGDSRLVVDDTQRSPREAGESDASGMGPSPDMDANRDARHDVSMETSALARRTRDVEARERELTAREAALMARLAANDAAPAPERTVQPEHQAATDDTREDRHDPAVAREDRHDPAVAREDAAVRTDAVPIAEHRRTHGTMEDGSEDRIAALPAFTDDQRAAIDARRSARVERDVPVPSAPTIDGRPFAVAPRSEGPAPLRLSVRTLAAASSPSPTISSQRDPWFERAAAAAFHDIGAGHALGVEFGQEAFAQHYSGMEGGLRVRYEQNPMALWLTLAWQYSPGSIAFDAVYPYVQVNAGGAFQLGPLARGSLGLRVQPSSKIALYAGYETAVLGYRFQEQWFSTRTSGPVYGCSVQF